MLCEYASKPMLKTRKPSDWGTSLMSIFDALILIVVRGEGFLSRREGGRERKKERENERERQTRTLLYRPSVRLPVGVSRDS